MTSAVRDAANGAAFAAQVNDALGFPAAHAERRRGGAAHVRRRDLRARGRRRAAGDRHRRRLDRARARRPRRGGLPRVDPDRRRPPQRAPPARRPAGRRGARRARPRRACQRWPRTSRCASRRRADPIAVAGTPTQCAAIDLGLERLRPGADRRPRPHRRRACASCSTGSPALPLAQRCQIPRPRPRARAGDRRRNRDPARSSCDCFGLDRVEASERDILWGLALSTHIARLKSRSSLSADGHLFDCSRDRPRWRIPPVGRAVVPPAAVQRHIGPGVAASSAPPAAWTTQ